IINLAPLTNYFMRLRAYDGIPNISPNSAVASAVTLTPDTTPPTISITSPADASTLSDIVTITGTATDNVFVSSVGIFANNTLVGVASGTNPWTLTWDARILTNGPYTLKAQAWDGSGNTATASISVTILNPGQAIYNSSLRVPVCNTPVSQCNSAALLDG